MSDTNVLQRPSLLIDKCGVHLVQDIHPLDNMPEDRMLPIEVLDGPVGERDKKLRATSSSGSRGNSHGNGALVRVLELGNNLGWEIARDLGGGRGVLGGGDVGEDGLPTCAGGGGVSNLGDEVLGDWM